MTVTIRVIISRRPLGPSASMDRLTAFGLFAVTAILVCYAMERRSDWFVLGFAGSCALGVAFMVKPPRTDAAHLGLPRVDDQVRIMAPTQTAAHVSPSRRPSSGCYDDPLNPPTQAQL
jgi:hypothetical protein